MNSQQWYDAGYKAGLERAALIAEDFDCNNYSHVGSAEVASMDIAEAILKEREK